MAKRGLTLADNILSTSTPIQPIGKIRRFDGHKDKIFKIAFSANGRYIISGSRDNTIRLWELDSGKQLHCFKGHEGWVISIAFSPDGKRIFSGSHDGIVRIWDANSGREIRHLKVTPNPILSEDYQMAFSPDCSLILCGGPSGDGNGWVRSKLELWEVESGNKILKVTDKFAISEFDAVAFSPDSRHALASYGSPPHNTFTTLWDLKSGKKLYGLEQHDSSYSGSGVAFSPDGHLMITYGMKGILVSDFGNEDAFERFDLGNQDEDYTPIFIPTFYYSDGDEGVHDADFSPNGRYIIAGCGDGTVRLWNVERSMEIICFEGHKFPVTSVAFSPNGHYACSGSIDGSLQLWMLPK